MSNLSPYELQRLKNIQENNAMMKSLGMESASIVLGSAKPTSSKPPEDKKRKSEHEPIRRSARFDGKAPEFTYDDAITALDYYDPDDGDRRKHKKSRMERPPVRASVGLDFQRHFQQQLPHSSVLSSQNSTKKQLKANDLRLTNDQLIMFWKMQFTSGQLCDAGYPTGMRDQYKSLEEKKAQSGTGRGPDFTPNPYQLSPYDGRRPPSNPTVICNNCQPHICLRQSKTSPFGEPRAHVCNRKADQAIVSEYTFNIDDLEHLTA